MLRIEIVGYQGNTPLHGSACDFGDEGGTIGRAPTNTLVLDDPERTVSRMHAQVFVQKGQYFIVDRGSNATLHNQTLLGPGAQALLSDGDKLTIGSFVLAVKVTPTAASPALAFEHDPHPEGASQSQDPFSNLLEGLKPPDLPPSAPLAVVEPMGTDRSPSPMMEALDLDFSAPPRGCDPLWPGNPSDLEGASLEAGAGLSHPFEASAQSHPLGEPDPHIDSIFNSRAPPQGDPLANSPLADPLHQPNTANDDDPLASLNLGSTPPTPAPVSDHLPIDQFGFVPPPAIGPSTPTSEPSFRESPGTRGATVAPAPPRAPLLPPHPLPLAPGHPTDGHGSKPPRGPIGGPARGLKSEQTSEQSSPLEGRQDGPGEGPVGNSGQNSGLGSALGNDQGARREEGPLADPTPSAPSAPPDLEQLLMALARGLKLQSLPPLTPALMERVGALLRSSVQGTLELLQTRQEFKNEVRAQRTMIMAQGNNPLKLSPTVEVAITHLLGKTLRGFLSPQEAMNDAYEDLRAHQFALMVGLQAALSQSIGRFAPGELEKTIAAKSSLGSLFPSNHKAKLWDKFVLLYEEIARETQDDSRTFFSESFRKAYEDQMARLKHHRTGA